MSDRVVVDPTSMIPAIEPSTVDQIAEAWVVQLPRFGAEGTHYHTYGLLTPYFRALGEGRLLGTRCINPGCPISRGKGEAWLPPRADCPDCHQAMVWEEIVNPRGSIYTYTFVERGGTGLEIPTPYYQIDVKIGGVCSIVKSYLVGQTAPIRIGDRVKAGFRTGADATHTALDLYFRLE